MKNYFTKEQGSPAAGDFTDPLVGGSLRDIQMMVGHRSLQTTQRYIEGDSESQKKVVDLL